MPSPRHQTRTSRFQQGRQLRMYQDRLAVSRRSTWTEWFRRLCVHHLCLGPLIKHPKPRIPSPLCRTHGGAARASRLHIAVRGPARHLFQQRAEPCIVVSSELVGDRFLMDCKTLHHARPSAVSIPPHVKGYTYKQVGQQNVNHVEICKMRRPLLSSLPWTFQRHFLVFPARSHPVNMSSAR
jgi:hypothetical protein